MLLLLFRGLTHDNADGGEGGDEYRKKKRRKSPRQRVEAAIDKALDKAVSDKAYKKKYTDPEWWLAEPLPEVVPLPEPAFDPRLVGLNDPLAQIRADIARIQEQKRREEEDIELLLMSM
jgi:hypothetical protein